MLPKVALIAEHREMDQQSASDALLALSMQQEEMHNALQRTLPPATPMPLAARTRRTIPVPTCPHSAAAYCVGEKARHLQRDTVERKLAHYGACGRLAVSRCAS